MIQKTYSGIGSRKTPPRILDLMTKIASFMEEQGYILQSGGADGADKAFESGVKNPDMKRIYLPWQGFNGSSSPLFEVTKAAITLASYFHPSWDKLSEASRLLMARNGYQVLGEDLSVPVEMIICYTSRGKIQGGTGQALRIANHFNIPVFNLHYRKDIDLISTWIKTGEISYTRDVEVQSWRLI